MQQVAVGLCREQDHTSRQNFAIEVYVLLAPIGDDGPISKYLAKKGPGIHHIAYAVTDILEEMKRLAREGFQLLNDEPKKGADNKYVCFVHPKTAGGVLVELCQEIPE